MSSKKLIGALIGMISFICTIIVGVYAMYTWKSDNTDVTFNIGDSYFYCESGFDTTVKGLSPVLDYRNGSYHTFKVNNIGKSDTKFSVTLNITKADASLLVESFKYKLVVDKTGESNNCADTSNSSCVELDSGNFSNMKVGLNTIAESVELPNNSKYQYYLFMYIDGNMENDTSMQNSSITSTLEVCEIVAFLEYNGGNVVDNKEFLKVTSTYTGLPDTVTKDSVTVSYDTQGGNSIDNSTVSYTFDGWYTEKDFTNKVTSSSEVKTSINHTLYAKYTDSGSITLPTPTRSGYTFNGWYDKASGGNKVGNAGASYTPAKSITLYAHWTANKYTVTLDNQGATTAGTTSVTATYGSALPNITVPDKKYTVTYNYNGNGSSNTSTDVAYVFGGYYTETLGSGTEYYNTLGTSARNWAIASNTTLYAKWTGAGTVTLPTPTRTGYTFSGWYTASSGGTKIGDGGASYKPSSSITLYAQWSINSYTVTYDYETNGGTSATKTSATVSYGSSIDLTPTATKSGYTFVGWNTSQSATTALSSLTMSASNVTLYAIYKKIVTATFYYYNSGINTTTSSCTAYNTSTSCTITVPLDTFITTTSQYEGSYVGYGALNTMGTTTSSTLSLSKDTDYYVSYRKNVTEYYKGTSRTIYRNAYFSSKDIMNTVLSTTTIGTSNLGAESYTNNSITYDWYGYATSSSTTTRSYSAVSLAALSTTTTLYTLYSRSVTAIFYYYGTSAQATANNTGTQLANYTATVLNNGTISIPSTVTSSKGPNGVSYSGLSTTASSTTTTTSINTSQTSYYAIYKGNYTASFTKENSNVSSIGSTSLSCTTTATTNGTTYTSTNCTITLPTITPASGYIALGWYDTSSVIAGQAGASINITSNTTYTAKAKRLIAEEFSYDNTDTSVNCTDVQCMIDKLDIPMANQFSYDNSKTGSSCTDVQCMLDELGE